MNNPTPTAQSGPSDRAIAQAFREVTGPDGGKIGNDYVVDYIQKRADEIEVARTQSAQPSGVACTCPSGDGSLRWPCPQHPAPPIAQQGGGEVTDAQRHALRRAIKNAESHDWPGDVARLREVEAALASKADGGRFLTNDQVQAIKDAAYRDGYERRHLEVLGALV